MLYENGRNRTLQKYVYLVVLKRTVFFIVANMRQNNWVAKNFLSAFSTDASRQLDVFGHDGHSFGVNCAQVGIFEKANKIRFAGLLQGHNGRALETQVGFEVLSDFSNQALERQFANQQFGTLLVTTDFTKGHRSGPVTVRFFDAASCWCAFAGSFRR
jgi:predicted secreted protein